MPPKKTETKAEGAAAPKAKAAGPQHTYQVRTHDAAVFRVAFHSNKPQDMITDAIIAVWHPVLFHPAHLVLARGRRRA